MNLRLEEMTLEQKLGMVMCVRSFNDEDMEFILEMIKKRAIGCVQAPTHKPEIAKRILDAADYPILIVTDMERGYPISDLPKIPLNSLAACNDPKYLRAFAKGIVRDAKKAGFNGNWGPIIDILPKNGNDSVDRLFSDDPETVSKMAEVIAQVFKDNHHFSCGKHFPGKSGIGFDTHMREGYSEYTKEYILEHSMIPYKYLLEKGLLPTSMVGHTLFKNIDPDYPASLSKKIIDIIRELGFDGVMFTDSFAMMGILQKFGEENIYGMAMAAGNDIILPNYRKGAKECYELLCKNFNDGMFTEERLDEAVRRILTLMEFVSTEPENPTEFTKEDEELLNNIARDSIAAITDEGLSAALSDENKEKLFIVMTENGFEPDAQETAEIMAEKWYYPEIVAKKIKENFPNATIEFIPEFSAWTDHDRVLNKATEFKEAVVVTFCTQHCYQGTDGLTRRAEAWINSLQYSGKISAIVHFGNPKAMQNINHIPRYILGHTITKSQEYAIDILAGKYEAKGKIPFEFKLN